MSRSTEAASIKACIPPVDFYSRTAHDADPKRDYGWWMAGLSFHDDTFWEFSNTS